MNRAATATTSPPIRAGQLAGDREAEAGAADRIRRCRSARRSAPAARGIDAGAVVGDGQLGAVVAASTVVTVISVPSGVWVSALSMRIRMICRVLVGVGLRQAVRWAPVRPARRESCRSAAGRELRGDLAARARRGRPRSAGITIASASSGRGRAGRSSASSGARSARASSRTNSRRASASGSSSSSSSTNPPSEKIGVRSSWEALAMNCLRRAVEVARAGAASR